ncbi:MAG: FtsQ-type POTRA domain-containing protein [Spirochaetales bacterium]|nr:FtsQ-type POTRA domain-containing protein [Spirochaetales bacterium]
MYDNRISTLSDYAGSRRKSRNSTLNKIIAGLTLSVFAALFALLIFQLVRSSHFHIKNINFSVNGQSADMSREIVSVANLNSMLNYFEVDCLEISKSIESISYVKEASVSKQFPGSIDVEVVTRQPVALFIDGNNNLFLFDSEGYFFSPQKLDSGVDFPILSGGFYELLNSDIVTKKSAIDVLTQLNRIKSENFNLYRLISEIKFDKKGIKDFELLVYLKGYDVALRFSSVLDNDLLLISTGVLDALKSVEVQNIIEIDYRAQKPIYVCGG